MKRLLALALATMAVSGCATPDTEATQTQTAPEPYPGVAAGSAEHRFLDEFHSDWQEMRRSDPDFMPPERDYMPLRLVNDGRVACDAYGEGGDISTVGDTMFRRGHDFFAAAIVMGAALDHLCPEYKGLE